MAQLIVQLSQATQEALHNINSALYVFKAVRYGFQTKARVGYAGGEPLVWFKTTSYLATTTVAWTKDLQAYVSSTPIADQAVIVPGTAIDIDQGQIAQVSNTGTMTAAGGGQAGTVTIQNMGATPWTCGLSQNAGGFAPTCAFPLYGQAVVMLAPVEQVLVMFAADLLAVGTVVETAYAAGLMISFETAETRTVSFDINTGWSCGGAVWGQPVPALSDLSDWLILT